MKDKFRTLDDMMNEYRSHCYAGKNLSADQRLSIDSAFMAGANVMLKAFVLMCRPDVSSGDVREQIVEFDRQLEEYRQRLRSMN